jgi:dTDP-4-dehydrorhamnose 3,5-epimerase
MVKFAESSLVGAYIVDIDPIGDERGFFARTWCREEFQAFGLSSVGEQNSISFNKKRGTLRGMHYQALPP